jgi:predicted ATPase
MLGGVKLRPKRRTKYFAVEEMNYRVNDKVKDVDLEAIRSKRNEEEQEMSHGLSLEDIVNEQS